MSTTTQRHLPTAADTLHFWFEEIDPGAHWRKDADFDALIADRFLALHQAARQCELGSWRASASGRLAEIIVLDQFSRNLYRDSGQAYACDPLALALAQEAIRLEADQELVPQQRVFLYMPFMHSESSVIHAEAMNLFERLGLADNLRFEERHRAIIDRFGRYPHRNAHLGRTSTAEELEFLAQPGSGF